MIQKQPSLIQMFAERAKRLYSPRAVAMDVLELSHQPDVHAKRLTTQIARDPALAARILRVVNGSLFATRDEVVDLDQAVALLGVKTLRMLVLGFAIPDSMYDSKFDEALAAYWRFTVLKASAAKAFVEVIWRKPSDNAFVAGLLHDLGSLVLLNEVGAEYAPFLAAARPAGEEINALERRVLGFEHIVLSSRLLTHWGLPEVLTQAIGMPLDADRLVTLPESCSQLPQSLHLADLLARFLMNREPLLLRELMQTARRYHKATAVQVQSVVDTVDKAEASLLEIFNQQPNDEDLVEVLEVAEQRLEDADDKVLEREFWEHERPDFQILLERAKNAALESLAQEENHDQEVDGDANRASEMPAPSTRSTGKIENGEGAVDDGELSTQAVASNDNPSQAGKGFAGLSLGGVAGSAKDASVALEDAERDGPTARLEQWLVRSRQNDVPVSLILAEFDLTRAPAGLHEMISQRIERIIANTLREVAAKVADEIVYVAALDRMKAIESVRDIQRRLAGDVHCRIAITKVGIASIEHAPPNFPATDWFQAAKRCLYAAHCSGGNAIKSIDAV